MKIPLYLTVFRIFLSPVFGALYLYYQQLGISLFCLPFLLLFLMVCSEITDLLDGYFARKWDYVTDLGKILDPMADSISRITALLAFSQGMIALPLLLVFVFFYRDATISTLRTLCALRGVTLAARTSGKIKAVVQAVAIFLILLLMIPYAMGFLSLVGFQQWSLAIVSVAALYTLFSGIEYLVANRRYIQMAWDLPEKI